VRVCREVDTMNYLAQITSRFTCKQWKNCCC